MKILSPYSCRDGQKVRIYATPQWARVESDVWRPISEIIKVKTIAQGGFQIDFGKNKWVIMRIRQASGLWDWLKKVTGTNGKYLSAIMETRITSYTFGHIVQTDLLPDGVEFEIQCAPGLSLDEDGVTFGVYDGVKFGVFFKRWKQLGISSIRPKDFRIALDFRNIDSKKTPILDLDPSLIDLRDSITLANYDTDYATARMASDAQSLVSIQFPVTIYETDNIWYFERWALRFNTSSYQVENLTSAKLWAYLLSEYDEGEHNDPQKCCVSKCNFGTESLGFDAYGKIRDDGEGGGYAGGGYIGTFAARDGTAGWTSIDITSKYQSDPFFGLGAVHNEDYIGDDSEEAQLEDDLAFSGTLYPPYLELEMAGPPINSLLQVNTGR